MPPAATAWGSIKYYGCSSGVGDSVDRKFGARDKPRKNFYPCFAIKPLLGACTQLNPFECSGKKGIKVPTFGNGRHF